MGQLFQHLTCLRGGKRSSQWTGETVVSVLLSHQLAATSNKALKVLVVSECRYQWNEVAVNRNGRRGRVSTWRMRGGV